MNSLEALAIKLRHSPVLKRMDWLWNSIRPVYDRLVALTSSQGLKRCFNGSDEMLLVPELRAIKEEYEPDVWRAVMKALTPGARVIDAGAHVGLYAVTMAKRVGPTGIIFAAEPDPANIATLRQHLALNSVEAQVKVIEAALSESEGSAVLHLQGIQSQLRPEASATGGQTVRLSTIDSVVGGERIDLILVDTEGFELPVLKGAARLLADPARRPKTIVIEVHPYAWDIPGTTSEALLGWLTQHGYKVTTVEGSPVSQIREYGHVVARCDR